MWGLLTGFTILFLLSLNLLRKATSSKATSSEATSNEEYEKEIETLARENSLFGLFIKAIPEICVLGILMYSIVMFVVTIFSPQWVLDFLVAGITFS